MPRFKNPFKKNTPSSNTNNTPVPAATVISQERMVKNAQQSVIYFVGGYTNKDAFVKEISDLKKSGLDLSDDTCGATLCQTAVRSRHEEALSILVTAGVNINAKDCKGDTALDEEVLWSDGRLVPCLFGLGARTDIQDEHGNNIFHSRVAGNKESYAHYYLKDFLQHVSESNIEHSGINAKNNDGNTFLHIYTTSRFINIDILQKIDELGADWEIENNAGVKAVDMCSTEENMPQLCRAVLYDKRDVAAFLLQKGANAQCEDVNGNTPLYLAARCGNPDMVSLLLNNGVSETIDKDGRTPLDATVDTIGGNACHELLLAKRKHVIRLAMSRQGLPSGVLSQPGQFL